MGILKLITYIAGAATLGLFGYLAKVLNDTGYLDQIVSMPKDDIMMYHIVAAAVIVWLIFSLIMKVMSRAIIIALLLVAVGAEGMFVGLNLNGVVEMAPESIQDQIKDKLKDSMDVLDDVIDDAKDKLDN
jgi:uncharacterized membrane protein YfbV (UPF0208 family)